MDRAGSTAWIRARGDHIALRPVEACRLVSTSVRFLYTDNGGLTLGEGDPTEPERHSIAAAELVATSAIVLR